jgi:hypothetical protein
MQDDLLFWYAAITLNKVISLSNFFLPPFSAFIIELSKAKKIRFRRKNNTFVE